MNRYKNKNNKRKRRKIKLSHPKNRIKLIGIIGGVMATLVIGTPEYQEHKEEDKIESNADIEAIRSFKNIKRENMGKYLENEIENLYKKYPDLDDIIFESNEEAGGLEFINDIYRLYKAFMVDESEKEIDDIEDVTVITRDGIAFRSDLIEEGNKKIIDTHKEQYKMITDSFLEAKITGNEQDATKLAKEIYELLALELGLEEKVPTSQEIQEKIENNGIYYDEKNNTVYTKEGKGHIVMDKKQEQVQEQAQEVEEQEVLGM